MKRIRTVYRRTRTDPGLAAAILSAKNVRNLARLLGLSHVSVGKWDRVPVKRVPEVSRLTGIPRHVLRPDFYEAPEPQPRRQKEAA